MCGEKHVCSFCSKISKGSPPRVRGEAYSYSYSSLVERITPACAGRRSGFPIQTASAQDHPRVCGEKAQRGGQPAEHRGSPPRVRGEADRLRGISRGKRITPACAGRRLCNASAVRLVEDHPRVCGEKYPAILSRTRTAGSPPRVRGEGSAIAGLVGAARITPACAGRSLHGVKLLLRNEDHPRVCGEKVRSAAGRRLFRGSPPRVRGEGYVCGCCGASRGITPACAGRSLYVYFGGNSS